MFISKSKSEPPPIENEEQVIDWLWRYSDEMRYYRETLTSVKLPIERQIKRYGQPILAELEKNPDAPTLATRFTEILTHYNGKYITVIMASGSFKNMSPENMAKVIGLAAQITILNYFLKNKYNFNVPEELLEWIPSKSTDKIKDKEDRIKVHKY